jgi:hypothetical protein
MGRRWTAGALTAALLACAAAARVTPADDLEARQRSSARARGTQR